MDQTFKVGDRVKFIGSAEKHLYGKPPDPNQVYTVRETLETGVFDGAYLVEHNPDFWYSAKHLELVRPATIPGIPDGYRLVRIGPPKKGELHLDWDGSVVPTVADYIGRNHVVLEKTTKTERLHISIDLRDGTVSQEWVPEGHPYRLAANRFTVVTTEKTREVYFDHSKGH